MHGDVGGFIHIGRVVDKPQPLHRKDRAKRQYPQVGRRIVVRLQLAEIQDDIVLFEPVPLQLLGEGIEGGKLGRGYFFVSESYMDNK